MMLVRTYVAPSTIEGLGVYAEDSIPAGTLIWQLNPKFVATFSRSDIEDFPPHIREFVERYSFPHLESNDLLVVELDNGRYMNHSEEPNTDFTEYSKGYTLRDIHAGEEITCNYHEFDPTFVGSFPQGHDKPQNGHWVSHS